MNIAMVGCGAVTELMHVPALLNIMKTAPDVKIVAAVDKNIRMASKIASTFGPGTAALDSYEKLFDNQLDGVIITLPNFLHAKTGTEFLRKGINVFLEKPMGTSIEECDALIEASNGSGAGLAVNFFKRRYPALRAIKNIMGSGLLGKLVNFNIYEGRKYDWPLASNWLFDTTVNKGGVLLHDGCHTIDILLWMLEDLDILEFHDDRVNGNGIETDCDIKVRTKDGATGNIRMSFVVRLKNRHVYNFEKGWIAWNSDSVSSFEYCLDSIPAIQKVNLSHAAHKSFSIDPGKNFTLQECFAEQVENFLGSVRKEEYPYVPGADGRRSIEFIEQCYKNRKPIAATWRASVKSVAKIDKNEAIAVLGASGFVGSALVRRLAESGFANIRPSVRTPAKGAAVSQSGYPIHIADLKQKQSLIDLFRGCTTVFHCAVGDEESIVSGITNCVEAAAAANVKQMIYISTARVYGYDYSTVTDTSQPKPPKWNIYAICKANAEKVLEEGRSRYGIDVRILRPCVVWGPNSTLWTTNVLNKMIAGKFLLLNEPQNVCNLMYIDNLIDILMEVKNNPAARNANFNVSDHHVPWQKHIGEYCRMLEMPADEIPLLTWENANNILKKDYIGMAKNIYTEILQLEDVKELVLSMPSARKYAIKRRERINKRHPADANDNGKKIKPEFDKAFLHLQNCKTVLNCENLKSILKYQPRIDYQTALNHTREWLKFNGVVN